MKTKSKNIYESSHFHCSTTNPFAVVFNSDIWGTPHVDANPHAPMLNQKTLVSLSFELDAVLWANEARFQPTNVLLHATASVLLLWLCVWMGLDTSVGTMCALLFATHPVHTEAVSLAAREWVGVTFL